MKRSIMLLVSCFSIFSCHQGFDRQLDSFINPFVQENGFSGSILVAEGENILIRKGYGMANLELQVPNDADTKFRLGSITKQFTAAAILILQEQGLLSTHDRISSYINDCPESWEEISIHHLLTHTSGIQNFTSFPDYRIIMKEPYSTSQIINLFKDLPLNFPPGKKYSYSNSGYILLGAIIENVSNMSYEEFLRENIFEPLKMNDSGYDHNEELIENRASGYFRLGSTVKNAEYIDMSLPQGAGALYSTIEDLYLWDRALYTENIMNQESLDSMYTPCKRNYGYGWWIFEKKQTHHLMVEHGGGINGFATYIARYIDDDVVIIILSNMENSPEAKSEIINYIKNSLIDEGFLDSEWKKY